MTLKYHRFANIFPLLEGAALTELADDIRQHGLREEIWTFQGKVLDGRNRLAACTLAGVPPRYREFLGTAIEALYFVQSKNLKRRHLTSSQAAVVALDFEKLEQGVVEAERAAARQREKAGKGADGSGGRGRKKSLVNDLTRVSRQDNAARTDAKLAEAHGTNRQYLADVRKIAAVRPAAIAEIREGKKTVPQVKKEIARAEMFKQLESIEAQKAKALKGIYDVVVIDPPWPMEKIERDCRPNQVGLDYPVMTLAEIGNLKLPAADDCHVWLWTTHRFLPEAINILSIWGLKYLCTFVWKKPGGFQAVGLPQFNCEFVLYARKGAPKFIDTKAFNVCFEAPRCGHSEKPEAFYESVRRVTAGRRADLFSRRKIDGFDAWGKEACR
jgi:N6-adenosine-specific RNA methylase IME4